MSSAKDIVVGWIPQLTRKRVETPPQSRQYTLKIAGPFVGPRSVVRFFQIYNFFINVSFPPLAFYGFINITGKLKEENTSSERINLRLRSNEYARS